MLLNNTEPLLSQLDVPRLNRVMATLASAVTGREAVLAQGIDDAQTLLGELTTRRDAIDRSLVNLETLIPGIAERDEEVERLLTAFAPPAAPLAARPAHPGLAGGQHDWPVDLSPLVAAAHATD